MTRLPDTPATIRAARSIRSTILARMQQRGEPIPPSLLQASERQDPEPPDHRTGGGSA